MRKFDTFEDEAYAELRREKDRRRRRREKAARYDHKQQHQWTSDEPVIEYDLPALRRFRTPRKVHNMRSSVYRRMVN